MNIYQQNSKPGSQTFYGFSHVYVMLAFYNVNQCLLLTTGLNYIHAHYCPDNLASKTFEDAQITKRANLEKIKKT